MYPLVRVATLLLLMNYSLVSLVRAGDSDTAAPWSLWKPGDSFRLAVEVYPRVEASGARDEEKSRRKGVRTIFRYFS